MPAGSRHERDNGKRKQAKAAKHTIWSVREFRSPQSCRGPTANDSGGF